MQTFVLYHAHCPDGFGAAYAAWKTLGDSAAYMPVTHGEPPPHLPDGARVFILDFAYNRKVLLQLRERCEVTIIDHHKTAMQDLEGLDGVVFDLNKSGAMLAWEYWHPLTPPPPLIQYIQDRDLYRRTLPNSDRVTTALLSYPMDFQLWDRLDVTHLMDEGAIVRRYQEQMVELIAGRARWGEVGGHCVPIANASFGGSDVAHHLCKQFPHAPFVAVYFDSGDKRFWSLTSEGDFDVSDLARRLGGGGHKNAAGFREDLPLPTCSLAIHGY